MKHRYPVRLSVQELRQELDDYLDYRRGEHPPGTVNTDKTKIRQFLDWLEASGDHDEERNG